MISCHFGRAGPLAVRKLYEGRRGPDAGIGRTMARARGP